MEAYLRARMEGCKEALRVEDIKCLALNFWHLGHSTAKPDEIRAWSKKFVVYFDIFEFPLIWPLYDKYFLYNLYQISMRFENINSGLFYTAGVVLNTTVFTILLLLFICICIKMDNLTFPVKA